MVPCAHNFTCGIPAGNCVYFHDGCNSSSGYCDGGQCKCNAHFACGNCAGKAQLAQVAPFDWEYTTKLPVLNGSTGEIDICDSPSGAAPCNADMECSSQAGGLLPRRPVRLL